MRRELRVLEGRALARWRALKPPILVGQPPTLQNTGTEAVETLGELMNYDENISTNRNRACSFCHMPYAAFSGPIPSVNLTMIAYPGTFHFRAGKRTAQRYTYSPFFPVLQYNQVQGLFFGGNFFDSRSTGYLLRNADAEQRPFRASVGGGFGEEARSFLAEQEMIQHSPDLLPDSLNCLDLV